MRSYRSDDDDDPEDSDANFSVPAEQRAKAQGRSQTSNLGHCLLEEKLDLICDQLRIAYQRLSNGCQTTALLSGGIGATLISEECWGERITRSQDARIKALADTDQVKRSQGLGSIYSRCRVFSCPIAKQNRTIAVPPGTLYLLWEIWKLSSARQEVQLCTKNCVKSEFKQACIYSTINFVICLERTDFCDSFLMWFKFCYRFFPPMVVTVHQLAVECHSFIIIMFNVLHQVTHVCYITTYIDDQGSVEQFHNNDCSVAVAEPAGNVKRRIREKDNQ
ncbi:hypothetical protein F2P81_008188 [Scophthalmus maximus]|uniref:Uncharacterized protein n=1 Tax=Scophthalmus maximus TaxID=52904 RepID=A0A6A4T1K7_SCOMX|nr:hypothetical protein F2P81_008188 [Scophthalmus maximus]